MRCILSLSYGKDSIACIEACKQLGYPIDRIIHAEVWATDDIPADLPPMVEFKKKADEIIKDRYGLEVEHVCAMVSPEKKYGAFSPFVTRGGRRYSYEFAFYQTVASPKHGEHYRGFPTQIGGWCKRLKYETDLLGNIPQAVSRQTADIRIPDPEGALVQQPTEDAAPKHNIGSSDTSYLGIAADEPERIERHRKKPNVVLPLVDIGWTEAYCRKWCEENDLLSPIYTTATRGGCWFCHNQGVDQLRMLRSTYPDLWALLLKWDNDSPVKFRADGHTVHDFDARFAMEDEGLITKEDHWKWSYLNGIQLKFEGF